MTDSFYRKNNSAFFEGKIGVMLETTRNNGGERLRRGQRVVIKGKCAGIRGGGFSVYSLTRKRVYIRGISPEKLDLFDSVVNAKITKNEK